MPLQSVGFGDAELRIDATEFALHFRVGGHRGKVRLPSVTIAGHGHAGAMHETFQKGELSFGR